MKNKNRIFRAAALLLVLCFISTVMISGTFAKYTSEYSGSDTALVARWSFTGNFNNNDFTEKLPIWDHNYVENIYQKDEDNYLIAPGVSGEFTVGFEYDADVDADLTFKFEKSGNIGENNEAAPVPIQYSIDNFETIYYDLNELADAIIGDTTKIEKAINSEEGDFSTPGDGEEGGKGYYIIRNTAGGGDPITVSATVSWRWPYDVSKHNDTDDVKNARLAVKIDDPQVYAFPGSGENNLWTDADDTTIGESFHENSLGRDSYVLTLTMKATQRVPGTTE